MNVNKVHPRDSACRRNHALVELLFAIGYTNRQIGKIVGASEENVKVFLERDTKGLEYFQKNQRNSACERNRDLVLQMNKEDRSLASIAQKIGTSIGRVSQFLRRNGETKVFPTWRKGARNGGRSTDKDGYVLIYKPGHPNSRKPDCRYILEHRFVMSQHIGRPLKDGEVVHHRNKVKSDNRIENLQLFSENSEHLREELTGHCPNWTEDGRNRMKQASLRRKGQKQPHIRRS